MKYSFLILILIAFIYSSCIPKKCKSFGGAYNFVIPVTLTPAKDTFRIGDTITISSRFSDQVYERRTDEVYTLENFSFFPHTGILRIDTVGKIDNLSEFDILFNSDYSYDFFNYSDGGRALVGQYNYNEREYSLEYKLILKKKGVFLFSQSSSLIGRGDEQDFDGKCTNKRVEVVVEMNNRANNNNIDMLKDSPDPHYNKHLLEKPGDRFHDYGGYCFYVVE